MPDPDRQQRYAAIVARKCHQFIFLGTGSPHERSNENPHRCHFHIHSPHFCSRNLRHEFQQHARTPLEIRLLCPIGIHGTDGSGYGDLYPEEKVVNMALKVKTSIAQFQFFSFP